MNKELRDSIRENFEPILADMILEKRNKKSLLNKIEKFKERNKGSDKDSVAKKMIDLCDRMNQVYDDIIVNIEQILGMDWNDTEENILVRFRENKRVFYDLKKKYNEYRGELEELMIQGEKKEESE